MFTGTRDIHDRCILTIGNAIYRHRDGGPSLPANRVRITISRLHVISGTRAPPFRVSGTDRINSRAALGCECLTLHGRRLAGGVLVHRGVTGVTERCFCTGSFVRVRAPVVVGSAPRNTHSCIIPDEVRGKGFCTLPRDPRVCGRLLVVSKFSECVRLTEYFESRSLETSHRPRFARVSLRVDFISARSVVRVTRNFVRGLVGRAVKVSVRAPLGEVAFRRTVGECNSSGPSAHFSVLVRSVAS